MKIAVKASMLKSLGFEEKVGKEGVKSGVEGSGWRIRRRERRRVFILSQLETPRPVLPLFSSRTRGDLRWKIRFQGKKSGESVFNTNRIKAGRTAESKRAKGAQEVKHGAELDSSFLPLTFLSFLFIADSFFPLTPLLSFR